MRINSISVAPINRNSNNSKFNSYTSPIPQASSSIISFSASIEQHKAAKILMRVLDLDGTFLNGTIPQQQKIINYTKQHGENLVFATNRNLASFKKKFTDLAAKGLKLPDEYHYIGSDGNEIYKVVNGEFIQDMSYDINLRQTTGYERDKIYNTLKDLSANYKLSKNELSAHPNLEEYKNEDPDFWSSKVSYYEWNAFSSSKIPYKHDSNSLFVKFMVSADAKKAFVKDLIKTLDEKGIKNLDIGYIEYDQKNLQEFCSEDIRTRAKLRTNVDTQKLETVSLSPANKGKAVNYLSEKLKISTKNISVVDDEENGISAMSLGAFGVLLSNATDGLRKAIDNLPPRLKKRIVKVTKPGAEGILQSLGIDA